MLWALTLDAQVATEIHAGPFGAGIEQSFDDHVCREALSHTARVEPGVGGQLDGLSFSVDPDAPRVASKHADARCGIDRHRLERPVVSLADQVAQDRRVEASARFPPSRDPAVHQPESLRRHPIRSSTVRVEEADLARRDEAAPPSLELFDPGPGHPEQARITDHDDMRLGAHRRETELNCHRTR